MSPLTLLALVGVGALVGAALGRWQQQYLYRPRLVDDHLVSLHVPWLPGLAAAVLGSCTWRLALAAEPALGFALLPLLATGGWLAALISSGEPPAERHLWWLGFATLNAAVVSGVFVNRIGPAITAVLGGAIAAAGYALLLRVRPRLLDRRDVALAAVVGLATGAFGVAATAVMLVAALAATFAGPRRIRPGLWLLAGGWLAVLLLAG